MELKLGGQLRLVPTYESNWDLGLSEWAGIHGLGSHVNEAGILGRDYVRTEDRLYFNVASGDVWDFYMALEFDSAFSQRRTDRVANQEKGIFDDFGLERPHGSVFLGRHLRGRRGHHRHARVPEHAHQWHALLDGLCPHPAGARPHFTERRLS